VSTVPIINVADDFERVDASVLGATPTGARPWTPLRGGAAVRARRAVITGARPSENPLTVVDLGTGDVDLAVNLGGDGECLYFRVSDKDNWWRVRNYAFDGGGDYRKRFYRVFLDKCVRGQITTVGQSGNQWTLKASELRVKASGNVVQAYSDLALNLAVPFAKAIDPFNASATLHGIGGGRGATDRGQADRFDPNGFDRFIATPANSAPNAPPLIYPIKGAQIDRLRDVRFSWAFSDNDPGDTQSAADVRWRRSGDTEWTTTALLGPSMFLDVQAGTVALGAYEWQVRSYDSHGQQGPWSSSEFFNVGVTPTDVTLTAPLDGQTIHASSFTVQWSTPTQDAFEVEVREDNAAGDADVSKPPRWSAVVTDSQARTVEVLFPVTNRIEHVRLRVASQGLWSAWQDARVRVSLDAPLRAKAIIEANLPPSAITVTPVHFAPRLGSATVGSVNIWRREVVDGADEQLLGSGLQPLAPFTDWRVRSGVEYEYMVESVGTNGAVSRSAWLSATPPVADGSTEQPGSVAASVNAYV